MNCSLPISNITVPSLRELCIKAVAPLWVNDREEDHEGTIWVNQSYNGKTLNISNITTDITNDLDKEARKIKYNNKCFVAYQNMKGPMIPFDLGETVSKVKEVIAARMRDSGHIIVPTVYLHLVYGCDRLKDDQKLDKYHQPGDSPTYKVIQRGTPIGYNERTY